MWKPEHPVIDGGQVVNDEQAWIYAFSRAWESRELDPEELSMGGFAKFGAALLVRYRDEEPAAVAARLYPSAGEFFLDLYPGYRDDPVGVPAPVSPDWVRLKDEDVPF